MATDREALLLKAAYAAGITSPKELANFMAQVSAESGGLSRLNEGFRYTGGPETVEKNVKSAGREGPEALKAAWQEAMNGKPEKLAELMYGGRMGNTEPGDGFKYHGRGYIQLTGKNQYREAGEALGMDLVNKPELAADPENASKIAVWYWKQNVQKLAPESVKEAGSIINTGEMGNTPNGLKHRQGEFDKWERALTPEIMEKLSKGEVGLPITQSSKQGGGGPRAEDGNGVLERNEQGPAVKELQEKLAKLGYMEPKDAIGTYGPKTEAAVEKYQQDNNLKGVDGKAGPETLKSIDQKLQQQQGTQQETRQGAPQETQQGTDQLRRDNPMFDQAVKELEKQGPNGGFKSREDMERAAGQIAFEAKMGGMSRIDELVPSRDEKGLIAVERNPNNPLDVNRAYVDKEQAAQVPLEQSQQQFNAEAQRQTQEAQTRQQSQPTQSGPTQ
ncbi:XVIPCD domain-containing protein [Luteimonas aquatica]|uniref:XVIPCD domain-containing protein n=1 Tax=Luteimonas aquatica TaxID=450364 RepID=UPI001F575328|nr:XVIPCD domain-containing protein [Luteimonas aquatica]